MATTKRKMKPCPWAHTWGPWHTPAVYPTWEAATFMQRICLRCLAVQRKPRIYFSPEQEL
jgi:hypothetical protein